MSLGFLTESALVPSKAKSIKVDSKSLVDLKAVVFQKDQERQRRLREALTAGDDDSVGQGAFRLGKYAHLRGKSRNRSGSEDTQTGKRRRNRGVEERSRRDEELEQEEPDEDDDEAWHKKSAEMLRKKAKLYEEMVIGGGGEQLKAECLVDFGAKKFTEPTSTKECAMVEITDEFGRTRSVAADSEEYTAFVQSQQHSKERTSDEVKERRDDVDGEKSAGGSFVVSQWEKRLKSSEKHHLKEVHERATLAQSFAHSSSSGAMDRKTRKQLRLERLRNQRTQAAVADDATAKSADSAASEKATDFLNQLSSLM
ncbi:hypothetical protein PHYBOEH_004544 [Phytophthora boehmeriae]|uniref:Uncharacterized protein n=1 Tax=Phytophthora boehmeriae TaxID=109152 RepID=A0A8T1X8U5_9STRA|nr:hypothetical protein PHYBOEH_004544 [Phytophthora boehmeriae]